VTPTRPILRWHGGKWRLAPWVMSFFPPHRIYVEPFGGGASILLRKPRAITEVYNDLDSDVVSMFRVIREQPEALARALVLTPYARDEYDRLYEPCDDPLEAARRFIARSYFGMQSKGAIEKSGFDTRINPDAFVSRVNTFARLPDEVSAVAERFGNVVIENVDAVKLLDRFDRYDTLVYADPPYVPEARSGKYYNHEMTAEDHGRLLDRLKALRAMVIVSGYASELYDDSLHGWERYEFKAWTDGASERTEVIWLNPHAAAARRDRDELRAGGHGTPLFGEAVHA
jgi:DNA adenine methylase